MNTEDFRINKEKQRFELGVNGTVAYLTYDVVDEVWHLPHTIVPKEIGGKGVGTRLVKQSLDHLLERNIKYMPICSFIVSFVAKHQEYKS